MSYAFNVGVPFMAPATYHNPRIHHLDQVILACWYTCGADESAPYKKAGNPPLISHKTRIRAYECMSYAFNVDQLVNVKGMLPIVWVYLFIKIGTIRRLPDC
jgi:hypothetical protein